MKFLLYPFSLKINIFLIPLCLLTLSCWCQDKTFPRVEWIKQFPPQEQTKKQQNLFNKLSEIVIGKKEVVKITRPVAVLALNPDSFLILDQAYGALLQVQNGSVEIPHGLKKEFQHFNSLIGICYTDDKAILFTDSKLNHIYSIYEDKREISTFNDSLILQQPTGIAFNNTYKQVWVVETAAHRVQILDKRGIPIKTIGKRGTGEGDFNFPTFICQGKSGTMFIVDAMNFRIQQFSPEGEFISSFGEAGDASGFMARPKGIATDSLGNIYIVDALFHCVQVFNTEGTFLYKFGQQGNEKEDFWLPTGIFIDRNNFIYIADTYNSRVQIFRLISESK